MVPGVIDEDYEGEIQIILAPSTKTVKVQSGQRIAQLLLLPSIKLQNKAVKEKRGVGGFGSSDAAFWLQEIGRQRPLKTLKVQGRKMRGLLDTGADVSCIAGKDWPTSWPLQASSAGLVGIGQASRVWKSSQELQWEDEDGTHGSVTPYVVPDLPFNLWGRDILSQMGVLLYSPSDQITAQMLDMGYIPGKGLGKHNQGKEWPVDPKGNTGTKGLGYNPFG